MSVTHRRSIWRAAAHPSRRRLLELLRDGPRTTGDLARAFTVSRFAVMKHLRQLEEAGLVAVRREGRTRWNTLIPEPLSELDRRWPGAAPPADSALAPTAGPAPAEPDEPADTPLVEPASRTALPQPFEIRMDLFLDAEPSRLFDALTFDLSAWWGAPYLRAAYARSVTIEGHLGGRFFEEWGHRQGVLRGLVTAVEQDRRLEVTGPITRPGPYQAVIAFVLEKREGGTLLEFAHVGVLEPRQQAAAYEDAWRDLLGKRLRSFVESGTRSGIGHQPDGQLSINGLF